MDHEKRRADWLRRARNARGIGDTPTADYCEERAADWWTSNYENSQRIKAAIERLEARDDGHDCV